MSKWMRSVVVLVAGIVLLAGVAGPALGQTELTWPITIDVSGLHSVAVFMQNTSPVSISGVRVAAVAGMSSDSTWYPFRVEVYTMDPFGGINSALFFSTPGWSRPPYDAVGGSLSPGEVFVVLIDFSDTAPNGARLLIAPLLYRSGYYYPIVFSSSQ